MQTYTKFALSNFIKNSYFYTECHLGDIKNIQMEYENMHFYPCIYSVLTRNQNALEN